MCCVSSDCCRQNEGKDSPFAPPVPETTSAMENQISHTDPLRTYSSLFSSKLCCLSPYSSKLCYHTCASLAPLPEPPHPALSPPHIITTARPTQTDVQTTTALANQASPARPTPRQENEQVSSALSARVADASRPLVCLQPNETLQRCECTKKRALLQPTDAPSTPCLLCGTTATTHIWARARPLASACHWHCALPSPLLL